MQPAFTRSSSDSLRRTLFDLIQPFHFLWSLNEPLTRNLRSSMGMFTLTINRLSSISIRYTVTKSYTILVFVVLWNPSIVRYLDTVPAIRTREI